MAMITNNTELNIFILCKIEDIKKLRPIWDQFVVHPHIDLDFYLKYIAHKKEFIEPFVILAKQNEKPISILVGRIERKKQWLKIGYAKFAGVFLKQLIIACHGSETLSSIEISNIIVKIIIGYVKNKQIDMVVFSHLIPTSSIYISTLSVPNVISRDYNRKIIPRWLLILPDCYEKYQLQHKQKHMRNIISKFENGHGSDAKFKIFRNVADVEDFCEYAESIAARSYQRRINVGYDKSIENRRRIYNAAEKGWMSAMVLFIKQRPVAFAYGEILNKIYHGVWMAYDNSFKKYSVGNVLQLKCIAEYCNQKLYAMDFGLDYAQYKERYGNECIQEAEVRIYSMSVGGFIARVINVFNEVISELVVFLPKKLGLFNKVKKWWRGHNFK